MDFLSRGIVVPESARLSFAREQPRLAQLLRSLHEQRAPESQYISYTLANHYSVENVLYNLCSVKNVLYKYVYTLFDSAKKCTLHSTCCQKVSYELCIHVLSSAKKHLAFARAPAAGPAARKSPRAACTCRGGGSCLPLAPVQPEVVKAEPSGTARIGTSSKS